MTYSSERLAYWYFRLNGFLTTENFIIHPDVGRKQRTDADLLAVRFKHRVENIVQPMRDDPGIADRDPIVNIIIAEVKTGPCTLNGPWTDPAQGNMMRVLRAIGCIDNDSVERAAEGLHRGGAWENEAISIRLFAVGESQTQLVIPVSQQLTWSTIIEFCIERFEIYKTQKSSVGQWSDDGRKLKELALRKNAAEIRKLFRLSADGGAHV